MPSPGTFRILADAIVVVHAAFVVFVLIGGLLVLRWRWVIWLHVPAALWGILIEYTGGVCPLTPLENSLRERAGIAAYSGDFVEHFMLPLLYPARLTRWTQMLLGTAVLVTNGLFYWRVIRARRARA